MTKKSIDKLDRTGKSLLHHAIIGKDIEEAQKLIDNKADPKQVTSEGDNILHLAVSTRNSEIVQFALNNFEFLLHKNYQERTALLTHAIQACDEPKATDFEIMQLLLNKQILCYDDLCSSLKEFCVAGNFDLLKLTLSFLGDDTSFLPELFELLPHFLAMRSKKNRKKDIKLFVEDLDIEYIKIYKLLLEKDIEIPTGNINGVIMLSALDERLSILEQTVPEIILSGESDDEY